MLINYRKAKNYKKKLGYLGEKIAISLLKKKNYRIHIHNYNNPKGEIDIIAQDGLTLCFIEVKTRRKKNIWKPADNLKLKQMRRIFNSSMSYLKQINNPNIPVRYDLIEIIYNKFDIQEVKHHTNFFSQSTLKNKTYQG
jgi:putative endonuclease